jgi:hypothetical protein
MIDLVEIKAKCEQQQQQQQQLKRVVEIAVVCARLENWKHQDSIKASESFVEGVGLRGDAKSH